MLGAMRLRPSLVVIATSLLIAACGGSSRSSSSATTAPTMSSATSTVAATPTASTGSTDSAEAANPTTTAGTSAPPEVPKTMRTNGHRAGAPAASQGAHVEVRVTIAASGSLSPVTVSVPSGVGVELRLTNRGSAVRTVVLRVPGRPRVRLGPGAGGTLEAGGQRAGTYPILIDGTPRGQLMSGAQGGP
jgi:hypothetical protein